ncbi:sulfurtransferase complex subunit TusC [Microbulbifer taiwanensis]|uniref:Sulfurtransferase complex subunit TusC n=1 Tax=Microbulbifer taiwanensis TaxID=986746 RepID=A0ABW1YGC6_9GAMM|nr:sulfurtransferase complex subunit TusC [Microbulbifer taiwanensis]
MAIKTLAICRRAPYGSALAREGLEAVLAGAAMEQAIDVLFMRDGVFQLMEAQAPDNIEQKNLWRNLQALPMFGVETLYVCESSLTERGIKLDRSRPAGSEIKLIADTGTFIAAYDHVLSF